MAAPISDRRDVALSLLKSLAEAESAGREAPSAADSIRIECDAEGVMSFAVSDGSRIVVPDRERQKINWSDAFVEFCADDLGGIEAGAEKWEDSAEMAAIGGEFAKAMEVLLMKVAWTVADEGGKVSSGIMEYANQRHRGACRRHEMKRAMLMLHGDDPDRRERGEEVQGREDQEGHGAGACARQVGRRGPADGGGPCLSGLESAPIGSGESTGRSATHGAGSIRPS